MTQLRWGNVENGGTTSTNSSFCTLQSAHHLHLLVRSCTSSGCHGNIIYSAREAVLLCFKLHCNIGGGWRGMGWQGALHTSLIRNSLRSIELEKAFSSLFVCQCIWSHVWIVNQLFVFVYLNCFFIVLPSSFTYYCVICITLIPMIIASVAGFLFICLCCVYCGKHSQTL